jgi:Dolichyl-phosphate-mannose-protein mannosyltransferase
MSAEHKYDISRWKRPCAVIFILALSFAVRSGTSHFMAEHLDDAGWFQYGSYKIFDQRAQNIIDNKEPIFFITDPSRTDLIQYPPGFPILVGLIYNATGERSAGAVLEVLWILDALIMPLLVIGIAVTAFGWRAAYFAGAFCAISPLLSFYGVTPSSDGVTTWFVLGAQWILLRAAKEQKWQFVVAAGMVLGAACWFRVNPLFLAVAWGVALLLSLNSPAKKRLQLSLVLVCATMIFIAPIALRNTLVFREIVLTGLNVGSNLWEGMGETGFGRSRGFEFGDQLMVEQERAEMGLSPDFPITPVWPDGIRRDRERASRSLAVITERPFWYAGVMLTRMWWMLKIAGEPGPYYGTAGVNCTALKCLSTNWQGGLTAIGVNALGMFQSVYRYISMLLAFIGIWYGLRRSRNMTYILLATVAYYLIPGSIAHTEIRYVLPMHAVLVIFAGAGASALSTYLNKYFRGVDAAMARI